MTSRQAVETLADMISRLGIRTVLTPRNANPPCAALSPATLHTEMTLDGTRSGTIEVLLISTGGDLDAWDQLDTMSDTISTAIPAITSWDWDTIDILGRPRQILRSTVTITWEPT